VQTALTKLQIELYDEAGSGQHVLPRNLLQLSVCNLTRFNCVLPLRRLQRLRLDRIEFDAATAAELRQLSALTSLTSVDLTCCERIELISIAAAGWSALPLRRLQLSPTEHDYVPKDVLLQFPALTSLTELNLTACGLGIDPAELAAVLGKLTQLCSLTMDYANWQEQQQQQQQEGEQQQLGLQQQQQPSAEPAASDEEGAEQAADAAAAAAGSAPESSELAVILQGLTADSSRMQLSHLSLNYLPIAHAEAAALAELEGLQRVHLRGCKLTDSCVSVIVLGLQQSLQLLDVADNPGITDACLPLLAHNNTNSSHRAAC
jgi:hypothetical protein